MAGAIDVAGNTPNGVAEFNVWVDPLAAKEVIEGMAVTLVPLDATDDVPFTPFFAETLAAHRSSPEAEAAAAIIAANQEIFFRDGYSFWDTLATALAFRPELATWDATPVVITASEDAGAGWIDRWDGGVPVRFATAVVAYVTERGSPAGSGVLLQLGGGLTIEHLRDLLGPDGSIQPEDTPPPKGLEVLAFASPLAEATTSGPVVVGACVTGGDGVSPARAWLTPPAEVTP